MKKFKKKSEMQAFHKKMKARFEKRFRNPSKRLHETREEKAIRLECLREEVVNE